jgi:aryl-alcohol dehydrogenase-like predicted oxidoreductase
LALGAMNFGELTDEATSFAIMDEALDAGINLFDTADVYGGPQSPDMEKGFGISEEIIGRWLAQGGRRDRIVLATKVYQPMGTGPNDRRLSAYHVRRACEASLRRLKTDHVDLYQMHHVDRATLWEEICQAMEQYPTLGERLSRVLDVQTRGLETTSHRIRARVPRACSEARQGRLHT